jgi:GT2 family glycosyltransferase
LKLSIVILNYNVRYFLELCLKSVQAAIVDIDAEIIVIDNNSPDESCKFVKEQFPEIILIENKDNVGFSKANNQAVKIAKGEYVCILNPDTVVAEDTFTKVLKFSESKSNLGIVGCRLIDGTGTYLPESKRNIPVVKVAAQKMFGNVKHYYANHLAETEIGKVDVFVGAFMFLKKEVYNIVGGFDEDYFMYGEDVDISYKLLNKGFDNYYYGNTTIIHYKGESTLKDKIYAKRFYGAMQLFYKKHFSKNILFDASVWLGIKFAFLIRSAPKSYQLTIDRYYFISDNNNEKLEKILSKEIITSSSIDNIQPNSEVIFDANVLSYNTIIQHLSKLSDKNLSFKILPKNSDFIIGSDDSINKGKVVFL